MKKVLITAGPVYGLLDGNKLVSNRIRGIWAVKFGHYLVKRGHQVTLLVADIFQHTPSMGIDVVRHRGFEDYMDRCYELAKTHDAAILAAAVVNWIPQKPYKGKMPTEGYKEGDILNVPFVLAPRVINRMKTTNPKLTLIGCKMLIGVKHEDLVDAAYHVLLTAKCNMVIANDMGRGLKTKYLVHKDRTVVTHEDDWTAFYADLLAVIEDEYYRTALTHVGDADHEKTRKDFPEQFVRFDAIVDENRDRFVKRMGDEDFVFGSLAVKLRGLGWLVSPREKGKLFTSKDAVVVRGWVKETGSQPTAHVTGKTKATLNAELLIAVGEKYHSEAVLHLHEQLPGVPTVPHAPPGTRRDNERTIPGPAFNIEGHGFIKCL